MNLRAGWELLKETYNDWSEDKAPRLGASLAYYTVFSLAPLLLIIISIAGLAFGQEAVEGRIVGQLGGLVGQDSAEAIQSMIQSARKPQTGVFATGIGLATLLFGASGVFGALHDALNTIWEVEPKPGRGVLGMIRDRFVSFTMVLGVGFLLMVGLVVSAGLAAVSTYLGGLLPFPSFVLQLLNIIISFGGITLLLAMIYKILPDVEIRWNDVWIGAAVTALLFTIGRFALGLYLGRGTFGSAYGVAGSLIIVLLWVYYSAQILFFGAEFTQVYANKYGSRVVPAPDAVPVTEEARARQGMPRREDVALLAQGQEQPAARPAAGDVPSSAASARPAPDKQRTYTYYGMAVGAAWLTFVAGLLVGTAGSLISLIVGTVRGVRSRIG
ncbi:MAG: YihY/virulence factor BrkB family protein [Chloroflexota bacterium]|nr:YihY/virulence factor BrkB family protein [Chloroflexota bacterium]